MVTKICSKCHVKKLIEEFSEDKRSKKGYRSRCKSCRRAEAKRSRENLSGGYIKGLICKRYEISGDLIYQELMEAYRLQIKAKRMIRDTRKGNIER